MTPFVGSSGTTTPFAGPGSATASAGRQGARAGRHAARDQTFAECNKTLKDLGYDVVASTAKPLQWTAEEVAEMIITAAETTTTPGRGSGSRSALVHRGPLAACLPTAGEDSFLRSANVLRELTRIYGGADCFAVSVTVAAKAHATAEIHAWERIDELLTNQESVRCGLWKKYVGLFGTLCGVLAPVAVDWVLQKGRAPVWRWGAGAGRGGLGVAEG